MFKPFDFKYFLISLQIPSLTHASLEVHCPSLGYGKGKRGNILESIFISNFKILYKMREIREFKFYLYYVLFLIIYVGELSLPVYEIGFIFLIQRYKSKTQKA